MHRIPAGLILALAAAFVAFPTPQAAAQDDAGQDGAGDDAAGRAGEPKQAEGNEGAGDDASEPSPAEAAAAAAKEKLFTEKAAADALDLIRAPDIPDVFAGLEKLSVLRTGEATEEVVDLAIARSEFHLAEYVGSVLAQSDPEGALDVIEQRLDAGFGKQGAPRRLQVCALLSELPAPRAVTLLGRQELLRARNTTVRREAIRALARHRSPSLLPVAIDSLSSKDADLRNVCCIALGLLGDTKAVVPLLSALDKKDDGTSGFAAVALGRIEDDRIFANVSARMSQGDKIAKGKALVAAARPQHATRLASMMQSGSKEGRIAAAAALGKLGTQEIDVQLALLNVMLGSNDKKLRMAAFHALGMCATSELGAHLAKRLGQKKPELKMYVWEIAGDIRTKEALPSLAQAMWTEKNDVLRRVAIHSFWRIRDADAITAAEEKIRAASGKNVARAAEILGMRRNRNGFDLALELIRKHKQGGREQRWIEHALEMQTGHFFGPKTDVWNEWIEKNPNFFEKEQAAVEREKWREEFLEENKGPRVTPRTEFTVQLALDYLARHQSGSGAFDQQHFLKTCASFAPCPTSAGARVQMDPIGVTSLCTLAYFGAGYRPAGGRYRGVLDRATEYLLARQMPNGDYSHNDLIGGYNRPLALQAYGEAYLATKNPEFLPYVQRGVDFLATIQATKGGWRYRVVDNANDTSVVSWVLFAAKTAQKCGAPVRQSIYEGCDLVLWDKQTHPDDEREDFIRDIDPTYEFEVGYGTTYEFHTGYQDEKFTKNQATTPLGMMSRILLGYRRSHPFCIGSANRILADQLPELPKKKGRWDGYNLDRQYPMYFLYYGTLSMHQMGGRFFRQWNERLKEILPSTQEREGCQRGSWASWNLDGIFSRLYTTAMGALTLETYYRYAPVLQD